MTQPCETTTPAELRAQSEARSLAPLEGDELTLQRDVARIAVLLGYYGCAVGSRVVRLTMRDVCTVLGMPILGTAGVERIDNAIAQLVSLGVVEIVDRVPARDVLAATVTVVVCE